MKSIPVKYIILSVVTPLVILSDQITKLWVLEKFRLGETVPVILGFFNFTYIRNTGAAFGILSQTEPGFRIPFFVVVPLIALSTIAYIFRKIGARDLRLSSALSLVIGGALGNLIDRVRLGYVVDFLDFHWSYRYHFPAFNIADSAICVGVGMLVFDLLTQEDVAHEVKPSTHEAKHNASSAI